MEAVYFDICAVILMAVLLFSVVSRKMTSGPLNHIFLALIGINLLSAAFDIWAVVMDRSPDPTVYDMTQRYLSHVLYLLFHNVASFVYFLYIIGITDTWHKIRYKRLSAGIIGGAYLVLAILLAVTPFTGMIFTFDDGGRYIRGTLFPLLYAYAFSVMLGGALWLIKFRRLLARMNFYALLMMYLFGALTVIIQFLNPGLLLEMFGAAISLLYITIIVHKPEDRIDPVTRLMKYEAYAVDMKKKFANDRHVTSIITNISNFGTLNSILGYDGMNRLLKTIADTIVEINRDLKAHGELYYLDRGRFRFVLDTEKKELIDTAAKRINSFLKHGMNVNGMELNLVSYVCITRCPEDVPDFKTLMLFGNDIHNRTPYTGQVLQASVIAEKYPFGLGNELNEIIDRAIADRRFMVYYQPIYSTAEKRFVSAEALLRLKDEKYGFIPPDLLIAAAEQSGAIHKIGDIVMEEVCRFIAGDEFEKLGLEYIEINLSVVQCMSHDLTDKILKTVQKYGVSPEKINLEITETAEDYAQNIMTENIEKLHQAGFSFSLDDYGTGYSNITRVSSLPLKIVKLDKSFVNPSDNPRMWIVLQSTVKMLKSMNLEIVVEGVETKDNVKKFSELHCDYIQGYYFSKPIPTEDFVKFILKDLKQASSAH